MGKITLKLAKIKSLTKMSMAYDHNMRYRFCENADVTKSGENVQIVDRDMAYSQFYRDRVAESEYYKKHGVSAIRKDAVKSVDVCIAVNRNEPQENPFFDLKVFCELSRKWVEETFGAENIAGMVLHQDEGAPHIHAIVIPMTEDGKLSCNHYMGSREKLVKMQDRIAEVLAPLGLQRGTRGSVAHPETMKAFYGSVNKAAMSKPPEPEKDESVRAYYIRACVAWKQESMRRVDEANRMKRWMADEIARLRQAQNIDENGLTELDRVKKARDADKKQMQEQERIIQKQAQTISRLEDNARLMDDAADAIQDGYFSREESNQLLDLLSRAQEYGDAERAKAAELYQPDPGK